MTGWNTYYIKGSYIRRIRERKTAIHFPFSHSVFCSAYNAFIICLINPNRHFSIHTPCIFINTGAVFICGKPCGILKCKYCRFYIIPLCIVVFIAVHYRTLCNCFLTFGTFINPTLKLIILAVAKNRGNVILCYCIINILCT